eukprot:5310184-Pyramimonas_sp.AAC.1
MRIFRCGLPSAQAHVFVDEVLPVLVHVQGSRASRSVFDVALEHLVPSLDPQLGGSGRGAAPAEQGWGQFIS